MRRAFDDWVETGDEWDNPRWGIEKCYLQLLGLVEAMGLQEFYKMVYSEYLNEKALKGGFSRAGATPDGEPYPVVISTIAQFLAAIEQFFPNKETTVVSKDLLQILRDIHYTITDRALFQKVPQNENEVHIRIEGILKCVFPDLKHKPALNKPIKNFEPDTGIPSIKTLIEYKFLSNAESVATIADEVLADTRGYYAKDWSQFIYVIYETNRFKPEREWNQLLRESGVPENTKIVVLSGEPAKDVKKKARLSSGKKS